MGSNPRDFAHRYKTHSCLDPVDMCDAYNIAFDRISTRWHGVGRDRVEHPDTTKALLRYVDCDITPLFCSKFSGVPADPVHLVHLRIGEDCDWSTHIGSCPVTWRFVGLPVQKLPWTRQIRVSLDKGGSVVVPAFPSAEEQMWSIMTQPGAEQSTRINEYRESSNLDEHVDELSEQWDSTPLGLVFWAGFNANTDNPGGLPSAIELLIGCYVERWLDLFLELWDGAPVVVQPRSCAGVLEERRRRMEMMDAWRKIRKKSAHLRRWRDEV